MTPCRPLLLRRPRRSPLPAPVDGADGTNRHDGDGSFMPAPLALSPTAIAVATLCRSSRDRGRPRQGSRPGAGAGGGRGHRQREGGSVTAGGRRGREPGIGLAAAVLGGDGGERRRVSGTAVGAGVSRGGRGGQLGGSEGVAGGLRRTGGVLEGDGAFELLAGEDDVVLPAHKDADVGSRGGRGRVHVVEAVGWGRHGEAAWPGPEEEMVAGFVVR